MIRTQVSLPEADYAAARQEARRQGISFAELVRRCLRDAPYHRRRALEFLGFVEALSPLTVLLLGRPDLGAAYTVLRRFSDQDLTLADAQGPSVMEERGTGVCWSTDFHFRLTGVPLVVDRR